MLAFLLLQPYALKHCHSPFPHAGSQAHDSDVNVISWNSLVTYMLASGADDGAVRIWDLRSFTQVGGPLMCRIGQKLP
jgi:WD40 repeat protein